MHEKSLQWALEKTKSQLCIIDRQHIFDRHLEDEFQRYPDSWISILKYLTVFQNIIIFFLE